MNLADALGRAAQAWPDRPAFVCARHDREESFTWRETDARTTRLAAWLTTAGHVARGDRVAVIATNCHRYGEIHFACAKIGAIAVPINHRLSVPEVTAILQDVTPRVVAVDGPAAALAQGAGAATRVLGWDEGVSVGDDYEEALRDSGHGEPLPVQELPDSAVNVIGFTSGTTGRAKGAMLTHRTATTAALYFAASWGLRADDRVLACMPAYVYRGGGGWLAPAMVGATSVVTPFRSDRVLALIDRHAITTMMLAPVMAERLLADPTLRDRDLSSVSGIWLTGSPATGDLVDRLIGRFGEVVGGMYGMTEATGIAGMRFGDGRRHRHAAGRPTPLVDIRIARDDGTPVEPGGEGELLVRGDTTMAGYWRDEAATATAFDGPWLRTGDIGRLAPDGVLYLVDRSADIINSGGLNVYSAEVERVIATVPGVVECAVIGVPDPTWGEAVAAYVATRLPIAPPDVDRLRSTVAAACAEELARYKHPAQVHVVDSLPRNDMGKIDKQSLRNPLWADRHRRIG